MPGHERDDPLEPRRHRVEVALAPSHESETGQCIDVVGIGRYDARPKLGGIGRRAVPKQHVAEARACVKVIVAARQRRLESGPSLGHVVGSVRGPTCFGIRPRGPRALLLGRDGHGEGSDGQKRKCEHSMA